MPELPEVHTITNDLDTHITGYRISKVSVLKSYKVFPDNKSFLTSLTQRPITGVERIAKNIVLRLDNEEALGFHLAMTGRILLRDDKLNTPNWTRVILEITNNIDSKALFFTDMRMFGKAVFMTKQNLENLRNKYGPEPISSTTTPEVFLKQLRSKRTTVKNALLDQNIISGLGNIYATDALFLARLHPETPTADITLKMAEKLLDASKTVLNEGIEHRGSTLEDKMYVDIFGKEGSHQKFFKIYNKETCPNCGEKVLYKKINGRGTFYCGVCQSNKAQIPLL